jgi:hypothetical protein
MRQAGLRAIQKRHRTCTTDSQHGDPVAANVLPRDFTASAPNRKWLTDITAIWTAEGWLYLAVVLDVYSRLIAGWAMASQRARKPGGRSSLDGPWLAKAVSRGDTSFGSGQSVHQPGLSDGVSSVSYASEYEPER